MIAALDIETIKNEKSFEFIPDPKPKKNLVDPAKIASDIAEKKQKLREEAALDPLTGRVCSIAYVGMIDHEFKSHCDVIESDTDEEEIRVLQACMIILSREDARIVTFNGIEFDLPFIYKRALILGVDPANFGAPPLSKWTKKYNADYHYDIARLWYGWGPSKSGENLAKLCTMVLHDHREDIPYEQLPELIKTEEGRKMIADGCLNHTRMTWQLFRRMSGFLFN